MSIVGHVYASHPSTRFMLGDLVSTDWQHNGRITVHRITAIQRCVEHSQTGTMFLVEPPVSPRGSRHWIDCAWFWVDGLEVL